MEKKELNSCLINIYYVFVSNILKWVFLCILFPSLTVEVLRTKGPCVVEENDPIFERGSTTTYSSFRKSFYTKPWSNKGEYIFDFKFWVCRKVLVFTYALYLTVFIPSGVNGSTYMSSQHSTLLQQAELWYLLWKLTFFKNLVHFNV